MNWLLKTTIVLIVCLGWASADESVDYCLLEEIHQQDVQQRCISNFINMTEFRFELKQTIYEYSGDDAAVLAFAQKYCPSGKKAVSCMSLMLNIPEECREPNYHSRHLISYRVTDLILQFLCNNTADLVEMISNNDSSMGEMINMCTRDMYHIPVIAENSIGRINPLYCEGIGNTIACFSKKLEENTNQNIPRLLNNLLEILLGKLQCQ